MPILFSNNASAPLAASITAAATSITVTTGQGALFPAVTAGSYFYATLTDSSNNLEIIKVTARSGDNMTVVRAQEGTAGRAYAAADKIELRITAAGLNNLLQLDGEQTVTGDKTFSGTNAFSGTNTFSGATTFTLPITGSVSGNAGTVTNGVYTTGDQTIAGVKTFSSTIVGSVTGNAGTVTNGVYTVGVQTIAGNKTFSGLTEFSGGASFTGTAVPQFLATSSGVQGRVLVGVRELRTMTSDNRLTFVNAANSAYTHTFYDNGDFSAAGKVSGTNLSTSSWTIEEAAGVLNFKYLGTTKFTMSSTSGFTAI